MGNPGLRIVKISPSSREINIKDHINIVTMARARMIYKGRVQGVFFRSNCRQKASELGLVGWVKNLPDGTVESVAEGPKEKIEQLINWNRTSQPSAHVKDVNIRWEKETGEFSGFSIKR